MRIMERYTSTMTTTATGNLRLIDLGLLKQRKIILVESYKYDGQFLILRELKFIS